MDAVAKEIEKTMAVKKFKITGPYHRATIEESKW